MEPTRPGQATIVDLLDRILDRGLVLHADLVITLADIPLLAVSLRAAVASIETMLRHGMMQELIESA